MEQLDDIMTTTELAAIIPERWSTQWYPTLLAEIVFSDVVSRDYQGEIASLGDTVNVTTWPEFSSAVEIQENERVVAQALTPSTIQLVINKQVALDYIVTTKAEKQSLAHADALQMLTMHGILKKMENIIISTISPSASAPDHQIAYDSGTTLALADMLEGKELMDVQNVPKMGRVMIFDAPQENDIFNITGFTSRDFIPAGSPLTEGALVTPILGFKPMQSTLTSNVTYLFHPAFMQLAVQENPSVKVYDRGAAGYRSLRVNSTVLFGVKQFSDVRVVQIG